MRILSTIIIVNIFVFTIKVKAQEKKIQVLNVGMFHMGQTSDANTTEYDESSKKSKKEIKDIVNAIAKYKPTIILVEEQPKYQQSLEKAYTEYQKGVTSNIGYYGKTETGLIGFAVGKLANVKRIYGIDHKMSYNYDLNELAKKEKAKKYFSIMNILKKQFKEIDKDVERIGLKKMLLSMNSEKMYNFLINYNADMLAYVNSKDKFEGSDEAAKYYKRNLRMFGNINKISMTNEDRVLIISGASHAAFFNMLIKRSSIYNLRVLKEYLN